MPSLNLTDFSYRELFHAEGLRRLDTEFLKQLPPSLRTHLLAYREHALAEQDISELLIQCAQQLEAFISELFNIEEETALTQARTLAQNPISAFKKYFVLRRAKKNLVNSDSLPSFAELNAWLSTALQNAPLHTADRELAIALLANQYIAEPEKYHSDIEKLTNWCVQAMATQEGQAHIAEWVSFHLPERIDYQHLIKHTTHDSHHRIKGQPEYFNLRDGFKLTDPRMNARQVQDEVNYCIYCHDNDGDFCSSGFPVKKSNPEQGLKKNPLDVTLTGCPLDEKISEMNVLKRDGFTIAALAMIMVDNPMCPATGHRICNDCMKACVYQKQDPVNIPQIETRCLTDVLHLPWGVEIYDLLTRWNPLRQTQWCMKPYNGLKVMIAGMGPAGFTLAHHLLLEGFAVVGFDGLKIEPLPSELIHEPIYAYESFTEALDERLMAGFGGVAEYGITVRWDKNFLKLIYLTLMRRPHFQVFGNTRLGGTVTVEDAWEMGFDHFVLAVGAGLPKALPIPGSLAPGMRQANDFLMALQLGNAAKATSLTNLQVRLPAVIIGGGLTGVDTATEVAAYYITQVEKTLTRYETLNEHDIATLALDAAEQEMLLEFLAHGQAVRKERERAHALQQKPNFIKLIQQWGGVTIVYRRTLQESPAYINNHEELQKAFEEGIYYLECLEPAAAELNQFGFVETLICHQRVRNAMGEWESLQNETAIPARAIFVATGTQPNTAYAFEHRGTFTRVGLQYQHYEDRQGELVVAHGVEHCKDTEFGPFTSYHKNNRRVSLIGDTHPVFHGSVVKAIASGMKTYPKILQVLRDQLDQVGDTEEYRRFADKVAHLFTTKMVSVKRCAPNIIELIIQAPLAAKHFQAGQFFRLQNYETYAPRIQETSLLMEPLALTAAGVDHAHGTLRFFVIEKGASTKICALLQENEPVSLMGPTGVRAKISHEQETVLIIGGQESIAFLFSYGHALRQSGNRVIYLGVFSHENEIFHQSDIEQYADVILWNIGSDVKSLTLRPQDKIVTGHYIDVLTNHAEHISLGDVDRIYLIGNTQLLKDFQAARNKSLKPYLLKDPRVFGSVYSTMQCMLKGVCAQCLQWQIDPETGQRTKAVFACSWPEQPLELIDIANIDERLVQNRLQEKLTDRWVTTLLSLSGDALCQTKP